MSTIDISRFLNQPKKHYSGARMQQGRVILDSDFNEEGLLDDEDQRNVVLDVIGPQGSPDKGFSLGDASEPGDRLRVGDDGPEAPLEDITFDDDASPTPRVRNYVLRAGSMYIGGMRFVLDAEERIAYQRDFLQARGNSDLTLSDVPIDVDGDPDTHFLVLEGWEQPVTAIEDREILEKALGGPDTSARVRRMRRVRTLQVGLTVNDDCGTAWTKFKQVTLLTNAAIDDDSGELLSNGRLHIAFSQGAGDECAPCDPAAEGRYLGAENQAFRVMLTAPDKYVWANDNAAPLYRVVVTHNTGEDTATIKMLNFPKDVEHFPRGNQVVEIVPWSALLDNGEKVADEIGVFMLVDQGFDPATGELTVNNGAAQIDTLVARWPSGHPDATTLNQERSDNGDNPVFYMRVWHVAEDVDHIEIPTSNTEVSAEPLGSTGLKPVFLTPGRRGDFWIVAARPEAPFEVVPNDLNLAALGAPPHGPRHFFAPLALVTWNSESEDVNSLHDCRRRIHPITDECCTVRVGDGVESFGDVQSIAEALDMLPESGGKICILAGTHLVDGELEIPVSNVHIEGCGLNTVVKLRIPEDPESGDRTVMFEIEEVTDVLIERLTVEAFGNAFFIDETARVTLRDLKIRGDALLDAAPELDNENRALIEIIDLQDAEWGVVLERIDLEAHGQFGVFIEAPTLIANVEIRDSLFVAQSHPVTPARSAVYLALPTLDGIMGGQTSVSAGFEMRDCTVHMTSESSVSPFTAVALNGIFMTVASNSINCDGRVWGGLQVQIGVFCNIRDNDISGGYGHGITLGGLLWFKNDEPILGSENPIAVSGVGAEQTTCAPETGEVIGVTGNPRKVNQGDGDIFPAIFGAIVLSEIRGNRILNVGTNGISAVATLPPSDSVGEIELGAFDFAMLRVNIIDNSIADVVVGPLADVDFADDALPLFDLSDLLTSPSPGEPNTPSFGISRVPFAAIMLPAIEFGDIVGNRILIVGSSFPKEPINGIYVLFANVLNIEGNAVHQIGAQAPFDSNTVSGASETAIKPGTRAGICVGFAGGVGATAFIDPIVAQADEIRFRVTATEVQAGYAVRVVENSVTINEGRALEIRATGAVQVRGNSLLSKGNHGAQRAQDWFLVGDIVFIQDLGRPWEACASPALSPQEPFFNHTTTTIAGYLEAAVTAETSPSVPELFVGTGGHVSFTNNEVQYLWELQQVSERIAPLSFANVFIFSLDHTTVLGNQIASRITDNHGLINTYNRTLLGVFGLGSPHLGVLYTSLEVFAFTADVSHNRIAHCVGDAIFSGNSVAIAENITGFNQTTTCFPAFVLDAENLDSSLFTYNQPLFTSVLPPSLASPTSTQLTCDILDFVVGAVTGQTTTIGAVIGLAFAQNWVAVRGWQLPPELSP